MNSKEVIHRRNDCRGCASRDLDLIFALKPTPIGDAFVTTEKSKGQCHRDSWSLTRPTATTARLESTRRSAPS